MPKRSTISNNIQKYENKFNIKFPYVIIDGQKYINNTQNMEFICPKHGKIKMTWKSLLKGQGCKYCGNEKAHLKQVGNLDNLIKKYELRYNKKFPYKTDESIYINSHTNIKLLCNKSDNNGNKHGCFSLSPIAILRGDICPKCSMENGRKQKYTTNDIIYRFKILWGNKYDYSKFIYNGNHTKSVVICPIHGEFKIDPHHHLNGRGCKYCKQSKLEKTIMDYCKKNNILFQYQYKIKGSNYIYDFYLPKYNTLIECQGEQHFVPVSFTNRITMQEKEDIFVKQIERDKNKYNLAKENNFKIFYFLIPKITKRNILKYINDGWYKDKYIYIDINSLFNKIILSQNI